MLHRAYLSKFLHIDVGSAKFLPADMFAALAFTAATEFTMEFFEKITNQWAATHFICSYLDV